MILSPPAASALAGVPAPALAALLVATALGLFGFIVWKRLGLLGSGRSDPRLDRIPLRLLRTLVYAFGQRRLPRYRTAGILHILIFFGFLVLSIHTLRMVFIAFTDLDLLPAFLAPLRPPYETLREYVQLVVLATVTVAFVRRAAFKPRRYLLPEAIAHSWEPYLILGLIGTLMVTDLVYVGTDLAARGFQAAESWAASPGGTVFALGLGALPASWLSPLHLSAFWLHLVTLLTFLCLLPTGKHFHVITAIPNVFLGRLVKGNLKPVDHAQPDLEKVARVGVREVSDFTWKHLLDFCSCTECGRCTDNCPANASGSDLSPKLISILGREAAYRAHPLFAAAPAAPAEVVPQVLTESAAWSCTTCGACEEECPVLIEFLDKIVDVRRSLVEQSKLPTSLQKPLMEIMKKGNPYGESKRKRGDWAKGLPSVRPLEAGETAEVLYFPDSCVSFDPRLNKVGRAFATVLEAAGVSVGILGKNESDSGNEVRRVGEEGLFEMLAAANTEAIRASGAREVLTTDPHALNAFRKDYPPGLPPVRHAVECLADLVAEKKITLQAAPGDNRVYTLHDACYLGRHNGIYEEPRRLLESIPGLKFAEMGRSRDRSFCCGGGGLMLWYEPEAPRAGEVRAAELRLRMAQEAGAQVIVTLCPYCCVNLEDAVKTSGNEGNLEVIDIVELVASRMATDPPSTQEGTAS